MFLAAKPLNTVRLDAYVTPKTPLRNSFALLFVNHKSVDLPLTRNSKFSVQEFVKNLLIVPFIGLVTFASYQTIGIFCILKFQKAKSPVCYCRATSRVIALYKTKSWFD